MRVWLGSYTCAVPRERFQNNVRLVLAVTGGLLLVFLIAELLLRKSRDFQPDFLASALLYGFTVLNLVLLLVLLFVLGRNLVRMLMEWRRGVFGARLRVQLLLIFLLMAAAPSVLLLAVGSDLIRQTAGSTSTSSACSPRPRRWERRSTRRRPRRAGSTHA
jgi:nitrogen fixation/metabolism regulation signal transduction histidine kinase